MILILNYQKIRVGESLRKSPNQFNLKNLEFQMPVLQFVIYFDFDFVKFETPSIKGYF
jgi:hypothetical protein